MPEKNISTIEFDIEGKMIDAKRRALGELRQVISPLFATEKGTSFTIHQEFEESRVAQSLKKHEIEPSQALDQEERLTRQLLETYKSCAKKVFNSRPDLRSELMTITDYVSHAEMFIFQQSEKLQGKDIDDNLAIFGSKGNIKAVPIPSLELTAAFVELDPSSYSEPETPVVPDGTAKQSPKKLAEPRKKTEDKPPTASLKEGLPSRPANDSERKISFQEPGEPFSIGKIETQNQSLSKALFISDAWDLLPDGSVRRAETSYEKVVIPPTIPSTSLSSEQAQITMPVKVRNHDDVIDIPLPYGFEITSISAPHGTIERSNLGTYRICELDTSVSEISYIIAPVEKSTQLTPEDYEKFKNYIPVDSLHTTTYLTDKIAEKTADIGKKIELIAGGIQALKPTYSYLPEIGEIYDTCGQDVYLGYEALQIWHCDAGSAYVANRLRRHDLPSLIISGLVTDDSKTAFKGHLLHSQVLCFKSPNETEIIEATSLTQKNQSLTRENLSAGGLEDILAKIPTLPNEELFQELASFKRRLRPDENSSMCDQLPNFARPETSRYSNQGPDQTARRLLEAIQFAQNFNQENLQSFDAIRTALYMYSDIRWYDAKDAAKKYLDPQDPLFDLVNHDWQQDIISAAQGLLDNPDITQEQKDNFSHWAADRAFTSNPMNREMLSNYTALNLLGIENISRLPTSQLVNACHSLSRMGVLKDKNPVDVQRYTEHVARVVEISEILKARVASEGTTANHHFPDDFNADVLKNLAFRLEEDPQDPWIEKHAKIIANLMEATGETGNLLARYLASNVGYRKEILNTFARESLLTDYISREGKPTEKLQDNVSRRILIYDRIFPSTLTDLENLGCDRHLLFPPETIYKWVESISPNLSLNCPFDRDGNYSPQFPISSLIHQNFDHEDGVSYTRDKLSSLQILLQQMGDALDFDIITSKLPIFDEEMILQVQLEKGRLNFDGVNGRYYLGEIRNDLWKIPVVLPESIKNRLIANSPNLTLLSSQPRTGQPEDPEAALWRAAYLQFPELEAHMNEILDDKAATRVLVSEQIKSIFTPEEQYRLMTYLGSVLFKPTTSQSRDNVDFNELSTLINQNIVSDAFEDSQSIIRNIPESKIQAANAVISELFADTKGLTSEDLKMALPFQNASHLLRSSFYLPQLKDAFSNPYFERNLADRRFFDEKSSPLAKTWGGLIRSELIHNQPKRLDLSDELRKIRSSSIERPLGSSQIRFARYLSDLLNQRARIQTSGGELLEIREYSQGDDMKTIDWNTTARTDKLHTKVMNEQMINPIHIVIDAEWLGDGATTDEVSKSVRHLFSLAYLAYKENLPLNLHVFFRGENLFSLDSQTLRQILSRQAGEKSDQELLERFWNLSAGVKNLVDSEKEAGIEYSPERIFRQSWIPPKPASVIAFLDQKNVAPSSGILEAIQRSGISVQIADKRTTG